jgi:hypothetical protein
VDAIANDKAFSRTLAMPYGHTHTNSAMTIVRTYTHEIFRELYSTSAALWRPANPKVGLSRVL